MLRWVIIGFLFALLMPRIECYDKCPFLVNGLNFVLKPWVVFFNPYASELLKWISESAFLGFCGSFGRLTFYLICFGKQVLLPVSTTILLFVLKGDFQSLCQY